MYQWAAFGAPWHTPATYYAGIVNGTSRGRLLAPGIARHRAVAVREPRLVDRGADRARRDRRRGVARAVGERDRRRHAVVGLAIVVPYLVLCAGWSGLPTLEEPGPRYLIPALPFLAVPIAAMWERLGRPAIVAGVLGRLDRRAQRVHLRADRHVAPPVP